MKSWMNRLAIGLFAVGTTAVMSMPVSAQTKLNGAGATFPAPIYKEWIKEYSAAHPDVQIDYQAQGSGAGITAITKKTADFAGSDAPLSEKELKEAGGDIVEFPAVAGGVAIAYNLPGFTGELKLSGPVVAEIFLGNITKWNDAKIAALNEGAQLPDMPITAIVRGDKSGTTYVFTNYLATQSQDAKDVIGVDKVGNWPKAQRGEKSDGVTQKIKTVEGGVGYIEVNFANKNSLAVASIQNKAGKFVKPTAENVSAAAATAAGNMSGDQLTANLWNQDGDAAYPIASFTYLVVHKDLGYVKDAAKAKAMVDYFNWAITAGQTKAAGLDYAPIGEPASIKAKAAIDSLTFNGAPVK